MMNAHRLYCDEAGGDDYGFIVVAGYLSTFSKWQSFIADWNSLLAAYNVTYFHMKEFAHGKGPFRPWKDDDKRRNTFMGRAAEIIKQHVERGFASLVEFDAHRVVNEEYRLVEHVGTPYATAALHCIMKSWPHTNKRGDEAFFFE
ncbi:MAG TPA: hypothetical protein VG897_05080, partial [Terriglobales bacterium]|nr:hypothetical protein [Terriglobales bacterium]